MIFVLLLAVIFGGVLGYFATQNTTPVTIQFPRYVIEGVPLYLVVLGSALAGLFMAWIFHIARSVSTAVTIYGKDHAVRRARRANEDLEQRVHDLEVENERLRMTHLSPPEHPDHRTQRAS
jgi:uncharacterized integral membrane protein